MLGARVSPRLARVPRLSRFAGEALKSPACHACARRNMEEDNTELVNSSLSWLSGCVQVCNHPYLVKGLEDEICENTSDPAELAELFINCSGKFVLLDKLLPKLQAGGHRVLIFSQMVRVLDLLADYLRFRHYHFERLDGGIRGHDRQVRAYVRCAMSSSK